MAKITPNITATAAAQAVVHWANGTREPAEGNRLLSDLFIAAYKQGYSDCITRMKGKQEAATDE